MFVERLAVASIEVPFTPIEKQIEMVKRRDGVNLRSSLPLVLFRDLTFESRWFPATLHTKGYDWLGGRFEEAERVWRMKYLSILMVGVALLMVGWVVDEKQPTTPSNQSSAETPSVKSPEVAKIDLDDNETLDKIIAEAIDVKTLRIRDNKEGEKLAHAPNQETPYTGWAKGIHANGQTEFLSTSLQIEDLRT